MTAVFPRFALVFTDTRPGVLDRETGQVASFLLTSSAESAVRDLNADPTRVDVLRWH